MTEEEKIELANSEWARSQATPHSVGPAEAAAGLMIAPKAAATWGTGKVLEAGLNLIAPDAEDTLLEQAVSLKSPLLKTGIKGTRLLYDNIIADVFDRRAKQAPPVYAATDDIPAPAPEPDWVQRGTPPQPGDCLLYTSPSPRDGLLSRMPSSA